ncbi:MAG: diacylglycerol kinase family protein [Limosilactobacillus sp.]|uniref:diacylglycerol kinase family protein n=1 Tax=Limosilactobacillus sp. TaxID=2773925 RepID=UPI00270B7EC3|nr:diacylglycerol kinase family protein [Limosilactobacillus sp.]
MGSKDKHQTEKNHHFIQAVSHALDGIVGMFKEERNIRIHAVFATAAVVLAALLQVSRIEWLWLLLVIFLVFAAEFLNTVTEAVTDLIVKHRFDIDVKKAKDVAAGGVLLAATFAVVVGGIIFIPHIIKLLK